MLTSRSAPHAVKIGEYLPCSLTDIQWAMGVQSVELASGNVKRIGEILVERERITGEELTEALQKQRFDRLRRCPFLSGLSDDDLATVNLAAEQIRLLEGEDLLRQDERGDSVYVVESGRVLIYQRQEDSDGVIQSEALPGDVLGEMGYFSNGTRSYSASALEPTVLLRIRYESLSKFLAVIPDLAMGFLNLVTERIRKSRLSCADSLPRQ